MQSATDYIINGLTLDSLPSRRSEGPSSRIQLIDRELRTASFSASSGIWIEHVSFGPAIPQAGAAVRGPLESRDRTQVPAENMFVLERRVVRPSTNQAVLSLDTSDSFGRIRPFAYVNLHRQTPELMDHLSETLQYFSTKIMNELLPEIMELKEAALEEESLGQMPLSNDSCWGLARFLNKIADTGMYLVPELDLTYSGNIRAEWESSDDEFLILEFVDFFRLKFVFFHPDPLSSKTLRISGDGSVADFLDHHPKAMEFLRGLRG